MTETNERTQRQELEDEVRLTALRPKLVVVEMADGGEERITIRAIAFQDVISSAKVVGELIKTYYQMAFSVQLMGLELRGIAEAARSAESGEPDGDAEGGAASAVRAMIDRMLDVSLLEKLFKDCEELVEFLIGKGSNADMEQVATWDWFLTLSLTVEIFKMQVGVRLRDFLSGDWEELKPLFVESPSPPTAPKPSSSAPDTTPDTSPPGPSGK